MPALAILLTYMGYNLLKQYVLQRVTGVPMFERAYLSTYAAIVLAAAAIAILEIAIDPPFVIAVAVAGLGSFAVLAFGRTHLRLAETFPELLRFPGGRFLR